MLCNMGARTTFSAIFSLRVFESVSKTCNMLPQQIVALKIVRALCYTVSTFSATIVPCNIIFRLQAVFIKWFGIVSSDFSACFMCDHSCDFRKTGLAFGMHRRFKNETSRWLHNFRFRKRPFNLGKKNRAA